MHSPLLMTVSNVLDRTCHIVSKWSFGNRCHVALQHLKKNCESTTNFIQFYSKGEFISRRLYHRKVGKFLLAFVQCNF